jgi:hypothetical protein
VAWCASTKMSRAMSAVALALTNWVIANFVRSVTPAAARVARSLEKTICGPASCRSLAHIRDTTVSRSFSKKTTRRLCCSGWQAIRPCVIIMSMSTTENPRLSLPPFSPRRRRRLEYPRPGTRLARLHSRQCLAQPLRVFVGSRSHRSVPHS